MTRTMFDSVTVADLPASAAMVGGYVDGRYANADAARKRFPRARLVTITVLGATHAAVVDIEPGDCTPTSGVAAIKRGTAHTAYCNLSTLPAVLNQLDRQKVSRRTPIWTAHYTGKPHLCDSTCFSVAGINLPFTPNVVATQYADHGPHGEHYDCSVVGAYWPGVDPAPTVPTFAYRRVLRRGMVGSDVVQLKRRLRALGYHARFMGVGPYFSRGLKVAVCEFQRTHHLVVDGVVGPKTAAAINR